MRNTLATAQYRNGEFAKAIETLGENLAVNKDSELPWDLFVLLLSHAGLGDEQAADHYFQMAQRRASRKSDDARPLTPSQRHELAALRAEAQAALESLRQKR